MSCCTPVTVELPSGPRTPGKIRTVALVGPPNSGKSTLFNRLTGLRQKVANYPGVTVEQRIGKLSGIGRSDLVLIDLPGIYSLATYTEDARVAVDVLHGAMPGTPAPDAILLVLDSMHLSRQLMLAGPVLELGLPTLILLNMSDVMEARSGEVDSLALAQELGAPVAKISATRGTGLDAVGNFLARKNAEVQRPLQLPIMGNAASYRQWATGVSTRTKYKAPLSSETTRKLDRVLLHRIWGPLLFLAVVVTLFQAVFTLGQPLSDGFQAILDGAGVRVGALLPAGWIESLLIEGVWKGVSAILVFLPQILLLFLFIGVLEDSGYLARAALIADRVMRAIGLNGKAFIPLLSAYACAVPAIMSTRTIENKRDRIATILVTPFMTCSARIPIYLLIIAAFIPNRPLLGAFLWDARGGDAGLVSAGFRGGAGDGAAAQVFDSEGVVGAVHSGVAAVPAANDAFAGAAVAGSRQGLCEAGGDGDPGRDSGALAAEPYSDAWRLVPATGGQFHRQAGAVHRAGDLAAGIQLEDWHRVADLGAGSGSDRGYAGDAVWRRSGDAEHDAAGGASARSASWRRDCAGGLFRAGNAVHIDAGGGEAGDQ